MSSVPSASIEKSRSTSCSEDVLNLERMGKDSCENKGFINSDRYYERKWRGLDKVKGAGMAEEESPHLHLGQELYGNVLLGA